jgi:hypothetical protein
MRRTFWPVWALALSLCASCLGLHEEETKLADGTRCADGKQCKSGVCTRDELCAPSLCDCPGDSCSANGDHSKDCESQSLCVVSTNIVEDVGQFFSGEKDNDGYCQIPCSAGCPEHFSCAGQFCVTETGWADPVPSASWSGAVEGSVTGKSAEMKVPLEHGKVVSLKGSATSPTDTKIDSYSWTVVNDSGERTPTTGDSVDVTIDPGSSFRRAELTVTDAKMRGGVLYVIFEACGGAGEECGYEGSGCCGGCDTASNLCQ